jgi:hypothetical protein
MNIHPFIFYFLISFLILIFSILYFIFLRANKLHPLEYGKTPVYSVRCSGILKGIHYKGNLIRVSVYEDFLVIGYIHQILIFRFHEVSLKKEDYQFIYNSILIQHNHPNYPKDIRLFLMTSSSHFLELLKDKLTIQS